MSDTPETDSYANRDWWTLFRANEHARELERQRDEARAARNECERQYQEKVAEIAQLLSERDEAIRQRDETNESSVFSCNFYYEEKLKAERERDEAREKLKEQHEALLTLAEHGENEIQKLLKELAETRNKMADALQEVDLRTLDFERMKEERDNLKEIIKIVAEDKDKQIQQVIVERDSAREIYKTLHSLYTDEIVKNKQLKQERDEAVKI